MKKHLSISGTASSLSSRANYITKFYLSTVLTLVMAAAGNAAPPNLVTNGSFEANVMGSTDPDGSGGFLSPVYRYVPEHQATITGWTFSSTGNGENSYLSKDYYPNGAQAYGPMADGNYGLRLSVGDGISQSLLASQAGNYTLSFFVNRRSVTYNTLFVDFGATRNLITPSASNYNFTFNVAAPSTVLLSFGYVPSLGVDPADASAEDFGGSGVMLDNIRVSVPEPSALSLLVVGLSGLAIMHRRKTK